MASGTALAPAMVNSVLIVEDDPDSREMLQLMLQHWGLDVHLAGTGEQAVNLLQTLPVRLALVDIGLPDMDGFEVARRVRKFLGTSVRLVAFTGHGSRGDCEAALQAGFDRHLSKPASSDELRQVVNDLIS